MSNPTTTTSGSGTDGQSNMLGVDLSNISNQSLVGGDGGGFDLTEADLNNPEAFGQHPPVQEHQQQTQTQTPPQQGQQPPAQNPPAQQGQQPPAQPNQQQAGQTGQQPPVDIASIIRETLTQAAPQIGAAAVAAHQQSSQQQTSAEPQLSLEELEQKFNVVRLTPEQMTELGFDAANPKQRESLEGLLHATAKMSTSIAAHQRDKAISALQQQLAPVMQYVQQAQTTQLKEAFFSQNPELKEHEQLLGAIYAQLKTSGFSGTNEEWFTKVGTTAKTILDRVRGTSGTTAGGGSSNPGQPQQQQTTNPGSQTTHRMTTLSGGGQGGASQGSGQGGQASNPTWDVWA